MDTQLDQYAERLEKLGDAHFARLRKIDRLYDTGQIDHDEMQRREEAEYKRYDNEIEGLR